MNFILRDSLTKYEIFEWFLLILPCYVSDMCPIFAWYPGEMFRAFEVKCRPIFETPADLLHIFATRHYCHLYQSKQHHHNNHHHQNNKHNHQNNKHHQNTTTAATTTKTQPPSQKTLKLWDIESLTPNTDRRGHLMWKKIVQQLVGWAVLHNVQAWWQERPDWCQPRQQQVCKKALNLSYFEFIQCANVKVKREKLSKLMAVKGRGMPPTYYTTAAAASTLAEKT